MFVYVNLIMLNYIFIIIRKCLHFEQYNQLGGSLKKTIKDFTFDKFFDISFDSYIVRPQFPQLNANSTQLNESA